MESETEIHTGLELRGINVPPPPPQQDALNPIPSMYTCTYVRMYVDHLNSQGICTLELCMKTNGHLSMGICACLYVRTYLVTLEHQLSK